MRIEPIRALALLSALLGSAAVPASVAAQTYPTREVTFIVPFAAGGSTDVIARQFTSQLEQQLRAKVIAENKTGASGTIGTGAIVRAKPDGYTIGIVPSEVLTYQPLLHPDLSYHSPDDYQPIVKLGDRASILFVRADARWRDFGEFMAELKANPGKLRASVPGLGTLSDLVVQQLNKAAGVNLVTVPFSGGGSEAMIALLGGRVEAFIGSVTGNLGQVQAGKVRALAVFQKGRHEIFPDATPVVDAGYDVALKVGFFVVGPKGLPKDVLDKLVGASLLVGRSDEFAKFAKTNDFVPDVKAPEAARAELLQLGKTFAELGTLAKPK
jgi:tripartite-type tricarboxylate transporter receptor subunit TctC